MTDPAMVRYLTSAGLRNDGDRLVWVVASVAIGTSLEVVVDDLSGVVLSQLLRQGR